MKSVFYRSILVAISVMLASLSVFAEEHSLSTIKGTQIDLKTYDHAIAGSIKNFLVWGYVDEETFSSELIMRRDEQIVKAVFKKAEDGAIGGVIRHTVDNQVKETSLYFVRVVKEENKLILKINGQEVVVAISGPLNNGHFVNPTYTAVINGETVSYALEGEACYSFSFHLAAMILGAYVH